MGVERGNLETLLASARTLRLRLEAGHPPETVSNGIRTGIGMALGYGRDNLFTMKADPADAAAFNDVCRSVQALPPDQSAFVAEALGLVGTGPGMVVRWTTRTPHPLVMPEALKAFELAVSMILGENAADRDMRILHFLAGRLARAARKAKSGTAWASVDVPEAPVPEYDAEAFALRDETVAQFAKVEERHVRLMEDRLRRYRPLRFSPDLAPPGHVNSDEERARIEALNERSEETARGFRTGVVTVRGIVASLDTTDTKLLATQSGHLAYAADLYFGEGAVLATVETDDAGNVTSLAIPAPEQRSIQ